MRLRLEDRPVHVVVGSAVAVVTVAVVLGVLGVVYGLRANSRADTNHDVLCTFAVEHNGLVDEVESTFVLLRDDPAATEQTRVWAAERIAAFDRRKFDGPGDCR